MKIVVTALVVLFIVGIARRLRRWSRCPSGHRGRDVLSRISEKLDLSDEQRRILTRESSAFRDKMQSMQSMQSMRSVAGDTRTRLADILRGDGFDENQLGELFVSHDQALRDLRLEFVGRLAHVYDALTAPQRERLASMLDHGPRGFGGPFRGGFRPV